MNEADCPLRDLVGLSAAQLRRGIDERYVMRAAWVAGSLVEGLGNPGSDVDVFVLVESIPREIEATKRSKNHAIDIRYVEGRRLDYEYWDETAVRKLLETLVSTDFSSEKTNVLGLFSEEEQVFLHRLRTGYCVSRLPEFEALKNELAETSLCAFLYEQRCLYVDDAFDDAAGSYLEGDYRTAALRSRETVEFAVDCLLHCHGVTNQSHKYRVALFRNLQAEKPELRKFYERFWELVAAVPRTHVSCRGYVCRSLSFAEELMMHTFLALGRGRTAVGAA